MGKIMYAICSHVFAKRIEVLFLKIYLLSVTMEYGLSMFISLVYTVFSKPFITNKTINCRIYNYVKSLLGSVHHLLLSLIVTFVS